LDSAGRLQVPKVYLEQFNIRRRVRLELAEEGILIRPVPDADEETGQSAESLVTEMVEANKGGRLRRLFNRQAQPKNEESENDG
jgi:bifunctional DNA-binding transcriptional regulator/antitoxin component of YhaV-PrlF toxin-antitoxin module